MKLSAEIFSKLRDKWRGWSDADLESLRKKLMTEPHPGLVFGLTERELNAFRDNPWLG